MSDNDVEIWAKLSAHEFLLENLWTTLLASDPNPIETTRKIRDSLQALAPVSSPENQVGQETAQAGIAAIERMLSHFWDRVEERVAIRAKNDLK